MDKKIQNAVDEILEISKKHGIEGTYCFGLKGVSDVALGHFGNPDMITLKGKDEIPEFIFRNAKMIAGIAENLMKSMFRLESIIIGTMNEEGVKEATKDVEEVWNKYLENEIKIIESATVAGFGKTDSGKIQVLPDTAVQKRFINKLRQIKNAISGDFYGSGR